LNIRKVKAHRTWASVKKQDEKDIYDFKGNDLVDGWAKKAVGSYDTGNVEKWMNSRTKIHEALSFIVSQIQINAPAEILKLKDHRRKAAGKKALGHTRHDWRWDDGFAIWRCIRCGIGSGKRDRGGACLQKEVIGGVFQGTHYTHKLIRCVEDKSGFPLWFCRKCGLYGQARWKGLKNACNARQGECAAQAKRFLHGIHPTKKKVRLIGFDSVAHIGVFRDVLWDREALDMVRHEGEFVLTEFDEFNESGDRGNVDAVMVGASRGLLHGEPSDITHHSGASVNPQWGLKAVGTSGGCQDKDPESAGEEEDDDGAAWAFAEAFGVGL
jgi:hypothetical protein